MCAYDYELWIRNCCDIVMASFWFDREALQKYFRVANYCFLYIANIQIMAMMKDLMCG